MARRNDSSLAAILLNQRLVDSAGEPFRAREYWALLALVDDPGSLLGRTADDLTTALGDAELATRIVERFEAATSLAFELEKLEQAGIRVVASVDDDYPARFLDRLGTAAPPVLHVVGPIEILDGPGLGIIGSRDVSPEGAEVAKDVARSAVDHEWGVVSGASPGVDRCAMDAALEHGGRCAGLLADSLLRVTREPAYRAAIGNGRLCLATPYPPAASYTAANAMGRNKLIFAASDSTIVIAAHHDRDSTLPGATEALELRYGPVAVWTGTGRGPSNETLAQRGARPVATLDQLWDPPGPPPEPPDSQLHLGV